MKPMTTEGRHQLDDGLEDSGGPGGDRAVKGRGGEHAERHGDDGGEYGGRKGADDHGAETEDRRFVRRVPVGREEEVPDGNVLEDRKALCEQEEHDGRERKHAHARHGARGPSEQRVC